MTGTSRSSVQISAMIYSRQSRWWCWLLPVSWPNSGPACILSNKLTYFKPLLVTYVWVFQILQNSPWSCCSIVWHI